MQSKSVQKNQNGTRFNRGAWGTASLVVACSLLFTATTHAATLNIGNTLYPAPAGGGPNAANILLAGGVPVPFVSANYSGTLTTSVLTGNAANPYGLNALTFTYVLTSDQTSIDMIERLTTNGWDGIQTSASYQLPTAGLVPSFIDRLTANVVGFGFLSAPLGPGVLPPGMSTSVLVVDTDATLFAPSFASVIDGTVTSVPSFSPVVPEPGTLTLLAGALMFFVRRNRVA